MNSGRELDALVAEKVMGWTDLSYDSFRGSPENLTGRGPGMPYGGSDVPLYSTDITAAWEVFEKAKLAFVARYRQGWISGKREDLDDSEIWLEGHDEPIGETVSLAICLAALKAVGHE